MKDSTLIDPIIWKTNSQEQALMMYLHIQVDGTIFLGVFSL